MKINVITPSEDYRRQAGARIRYGRLSAVLPTLDAEIDLVPIDDIQTQVRPDADVYLISKCHDVRAILVAQWARRAGCLVGVDLFDDYFSQGDDPRFARLRSWFQAAAHASDFMLCSTPAMREICRQLAPHLPTHVMNDPFEAFDSSEVAEKQARKAQKVRETGILQVAWFGMGDNPYFQVGLSDLAAFAGELCAMRGHGLDIRLKIRTNRRALTPDTLAALRRLPVPFELGEWSEVAEAELLEDSYAAFLPVNGQPFSTAKSLNRAVTALSAGVQVLSAGYPLYACFDSLIYRCGAELARDAASGSARLNKESAPILASALTQYAEPAKEAEGFLRFLQKLSPRMARRAEDRTDGRPLAAVVHGREIPPNSFAFARAIGAITVGTPMALQKFDYDIRMMSGTPEGGPELLVRESLTPLLDATEMRWGRQVVLNKVSYLKVSLGAQMKREGLDLLATKQPEALVAAHSAVLAEAGRLTRALFPGIPLILSEDLRLPWRIPAGFPGSAWKPV